MSQPSKVAIVVSQYNETITRKLLLGALETLQEHGFEQSHVTTQWVPGAWEIPIVIQRLLKREDVVGGIALGAVIRGETTHDQHINRAVSQALMQLSLAMDKPVSFGVLTTNSIEQAIARAGGTVGNKGHEAALALVQVLKVLRTYPQTEPS